MRKTIALGTILILVQVPLLALVLLQERTGAVRTEMERRGSRPPAMAACM